MQEIERRSEGVWRPSPGSVYPALQQLEDEGLVRSDETGAGKRFHLTDAGREAADKAAAEGAPWDAASESVDSDAWELFGVARQVGMAIFQIAQVGTAEQLASAREVLTNARRSLYGILAEEEEQPPEEAHDQSRRNVTSSPSSSQTAKPHFSSTRSEPAFHLATPAYSGRAVSRSRKAASAAVATPAPQNSRPIQ